VSGAGVRAAGEAAAGGPVRVAFQGERGAYSEEAIARHWGAAADPVPARTCADVAALVAAGAADYGVLAAENTLAGSVAATADALAAAPEVAAAGEVVLPVHHCVLGVPGATLAGLRVVESHPVALAQCGRFLGRHPHVTARAGYDTAGAARDVAERGDARVGAVAGRAAAARYGLVVLAADVEDRPDNQTRFLVIAQAGSAAVTAAAPPAGAPARTALLAVPPNVPGALVRLLLPFAEAGLNLNTVESRPTGDPWAYRFYVEVEHAAGDARLDAALRAARRAAGDGPGALRVLGTFARAAAPGAGPNRTPAGVGAAAPAGAGR
jgi:prephenate dehydratase